VNKFLKNACLIGSLVFMLGLAGAVTYEFGSKVALGDSDVGNLLYNTVPEFRYWDLGPVGYDQGDIVYMLMRSTTCGSGCNLVSPNDIRITPFGALAAGTKVTANDNDINKPLSQENFNVMFTNLYGGPGYDFDDPVYLHVGPATPGTPTVTNDVRLNNIVNGFSAGTKVLDYDGDHNKPLVSLPPYAIRYFNANGNYDNSGKPLYDFADSVYLDFSMGSANPGFVVVNDVRLSV
jgi:hypothetical protein